MCLQLCVVGARMAEDWRQAVEIVYVGVGMAEEASCRDSSCECRNG